MDSPMDSGPATGLPRCLPQSAVAPGILSPPQGWGTSYGVWSVLELPTTPLHTVLEIPKPGVHSDHSL